MSKMSTQKVVKLSCHKNTIEQRRRKWNRDRAVKDAKGLCVDGYLLIGWRISPNGELSTSFSGYKNVRANNAGISQELPRAVEQFLEATNLDENVRSESDLFSPDEGA